LTEKLQEVILARVFRFIFPILMGCFTIVHSQLPDSSGRANIVQLESTVVLLKDSVRLHTLITEIEGIIRAQKQADSANPHKNALIVKTIGTADSLLMFHSLSGFSNGLSNVYKELIASSDVVIKYSNFSGFTTTRDLLLFLLMTTIAVIAGIAVWWIIRRLSWNVVKTDTQGISGSNRLLGYLLLLFSRLASGSGLATVLFLLYISAGKTSFGLLMLHFTAAVAIYASVSAILNVFFSKKFPQYRVVHTISTTTDSAVKLTSSILSFACIFWFLYSISLFLNLISTPAMIAGIYKVVLTFQITLLAYRLQKFVKKDSDNTGIGKFQELIVATVRFLAKKVYIVVFLASVVLTVSSLSIDKTLYHYLLRSMFQTLLLVACVALLYWLLIILLKHIRNVSDDNQQERPWFDQLLLTNRKTVERGGFVLISFTGLFLLIKIWGFDIFRTSQSDLPLVAAILHIFFIIVTALIIMQITQLLIKGFQTKAWKNMMQSGTTEIEIKKRLDTLGSIFQKIIGTTIGIIAVIMIIDELGFDIKAMLAGVGVAGLAVGFGAQNLVRDVISGLFVIFENRIRVGDVAIINGTGGLVEQVNLRTIVLRSMDGTIHVFPNGAINSLSNMTHEYSYYVFDIGVAYKEDTDRVIQVLKSVGTSILDDAQYRQSILEPLEILGLDKFGTSEIVIKARIKTIPIKQWEVGREMNRRIKIAFDKEGIEIPYPHQSIYFGENSKPFSVKLEGLSTEFNGTKMNAPDFRDR
jgi:small conductance mechanosensitive channel